ncbi:MAG: protein phosphatase 2C domain-containing protein [Lachnospiraceae bacterium]
MIRKMSHMGRYHAEMNGENQDAICSGTEKDITVISLADGVSTCKEARIGAKIASEAITNLFLKKGKQFLEYEPQNIAAFTLSHILHQLNRQASEDAENVDEYSSTLASVLVDKKKGKILSFCLGDSMILAIGKEKCSVLSMPSDSSSGCYVTTTKQVSEMAQVKVCDLGLMESIVICSDGAWKQMFCKNRLKPEVKDLLIHFEYEALEEFLMKQDCYDDYSFVALDIRQKNRRKTA